LPYCWCWRSFAVRTRCISLRLRCRVVAAVPLSCHSSLLVRTRWLGFSGARCPHFGQCVPERRAPPRPGQHGLQIRLLKRW
jgi:hypothetical protein